MSVIALKAPAQLLASLDPKFPFFGTGLGTFGFVFPLFEQSAQLSWAGHADNEYAQLMTETGAPCWQPDPPSIGACQVQ